MKSLLIVANFKSNMTSTEATDWLQNFSNYKANPNKKVVLCPSFTLLQLFNKYIKDQNLDIGLGAQNISRLPQGPYTGEVNGAQIKDFAEYVLIGHSERRQFGEDESVVEEKVKISIDYKLTPILFVQDENNVVPQEVTVAVYEPPSAISTSSNPIIESPENANSIAQKLKNEREISILYGGSVDSKNVKDFTKEENISGVLVGNASLDAKEFLKIVEMA